MPIKRTKPSEERKDVAVASMSVSSTGQLQRGKTVGVGLSLQAECELLQQEAPQYRSASAAQKKEILNTFTRSTGYHRIFAMWLLNHPEEGQLAPARPRPRQYGEEVLKVLVLAWEKMNCIASREASCAVGAPFPMKRNSMDAPATLRTKDPNSENEFLR